MCGDAIVANPVGYLWRRAGTKQPNSFYRLDQWHPLTFADMN